MAKKQGDLSLMEEAVKTARAVGVKKTVEILIELRKVESSSIFKEKKEIILNEIFVDFGTNMKRLLGKKHDGRFPRMFTYVLLKRHLSMDVNEIGHVFKRSGNTVYCELAEFSRLNPNNSKNPEEAQLLERFKRLEQIILKRIG